MPNTHQKPNTNGQELGELAALISQQVSREIRSELEAFAPVAGTPPDKVLWDAKDCARYLRVSKRHFSERLSNHHNFPAPAKLPSETGQRERRRWYARDVINWLARNG